MSQTENANKQGSTRTRNPWYNELLSGGTRWLYESVTVRVRSRSDTRGRQEGTRRAIGRHWSAVRQRREKERSCVIAATGVIKDLVYTYM